MITSLSEHYFRFRRFILFIQNCWKRVLEAAKLAYAINQKNPSLPRNLALGTCGKLLIVFSTKVNLLYLFYSIEWRCFLPHLIKQNYFLKPFLRNSNLDNPGISLPVFPSRPNLKLHNISITPKMVKKVIANLYSSKASGPDCILVVVLKNCEPKLSYILAELFSICV